MMNRESEPDIIEHGGDRRHARLNDRLDRERRVRWRALIPATARERISLLLAFALGAAAGIAGWASWDRAAEARAERSSVTLAAWLGYSDMPEFGGKPTLETQVLLRNAGALPVWVTDLELVQPGLEPQGTPAGELEVPAGEVATTSVRSELSCAEFDQSRPPELVLQARPVSGKAQAVRLTLTSAGDTGWLGGMCAAGDESLVEIHLNLQGGATVTGTGRTARLRAPVSVTTFGPMPGTGEVTLTGMRSDTDALVLTAEGLPLALSGAMPGSETTPFALVWRVADCAGAVDLTAGRYSTIQLAGRRDGVSREFIGTARLEPDLLLALVRFVYSTCP
jgi:hypothetical protein